MADSEVNKKRSVRLNFEGSGVGQTLGPLETEIMEILWKSSPVSVRDVYERLRQERPIAYTTVMTVLNRLCEKELLEREQSGRAYIYSPVMNRDEYCSDTLHRVMKRLLNGFGDPVLSHFVDAVEDQDADQLDKLIKIIEEKKKQEGQ
jgi:predicted transcriptional regulator